MFIGKIFYSSVIAYIFSVAYDVFLIGVFLFFKKYLKQFTIINKCGKNISYIKSHVNVSIL